MARRPKLYVPLVVHFFDDDRIVEVGDGPTLLYLAMCCRAKALGSDGRLTASQIGRLHRPRWKAELGRLVDVDLVLFNDAANEYLISSWFSHNDSVRVTEERLARERSRKARRIPDGNRTDSGRNPSGNGGAFREHSGWQEEKSKEERSEGTDSARNRHAFDDPDNTGVCRCGLPPANACHLRIVAGGESA